jgi:folate-binding protein YgfZ
MKAAILKDRGVVKVAGEGARAFLQGLLTVDVSKLAPGTARFGALLTPQGKIIADFFVTEAPAATGGGFFFDVPRTEAGALVAKLKLYRLRAKVEIEDVSEALAVLAAWGGSDTSSSGLSYPDPRLAALGLRLILAPERIEASVRALGAELVDVAAYEAHRIALGIPRGGVDFAYGDTFPHEADMDQLGGVDFGKGCYVGQEVVSRMQHRGTARNRVVPVRYTAAKAPPPGTPISVGERAVGTMGSSAAGQGLALLRLDRVAQANAAGAGLQAGGTDVLVVKPEWANFVWPAGSDDDAPGKAAG